MDYWHHGADDRLRNPPQDQPGAFTGQGKDGRPAVESVKFIISAFSVRTLLAVRQEGHPACKILGDGLLVVTS